MQPGYHITVSAFGRRRKRQTAVRGIRQPTEIEKGGVFRMVLLPVPKKMEEKDGCYMLQLHNMIVIDASCEQGAVIYARMLKEEIRTWAGIELAVGRGTGQTGDILLKTDPTLGRQQYTLAIHADGAVLCAGSLDALGWAVQTMRQIVRQSAGLLPEVIIADEPDQKNRGFYYDVSRGRVLTLESLKWLADTMAFYKLNQLQLYVEHTYLFRGLTEVWRDETPLTAEEILELDQYCYDRGIELVPSLSTFGHLFKLLSTKSFGAFCEMPDLAGEAFSFLDRMNHHTVNVSEPGAISLIKAMILEYMQLFRSDKFNICADETFDLGKGRSKALAEEKGIGSLYMDYILQLFGFLIENGRTPMFWGDIIVKYPELYARIPKQVICLNWGYCATQPDREAKILHEAGAVQYLCPGACGWNTWVNKLNDSYENIRRMCSYARQYEAIGILNTEWGDFGHINQPVFSVPGMIYAAAGSWSQELLSYEEINRRISILQFHDTSGRLLDILGRVDAQTVFSWNQAVCLKEGVQKQMGREGLREIFWQEDWKDGPARNACILELEKELLAASRSMDSSSRQVVECAYVAMEAVRLWNEAGLYLYSLQQGKKPDGGMELAAGLERCLHAYQKLWRETGKEAGLGRITEVFCWYADVLRDMEKNP